MVSLITVWLIFTRSPLLDSWGYYKVAALCFAIDIAIVRLWILIERDV